MQGLQAAASSVKYIGGKKAQLLSRLSIDTLEDALCTYPRDYEDRLHILPIASLAAEQKGCIQATVGTMPRLTRLKGGIRMATLTVYDESGTLRVVFFHNTYAATQLRQGQQYLFYGAVSIFGWEKSMANPQFERILPNVPVEGKLVPIYPLTGGLSQRDMQRITEAALLALPQEYPDPIPQPMLLRHNLPHARDAFFHIHRPKTLEDMQQARRRMVFEELFLLSCGLQQIRVQRTRMHGLIFDQTTLAPFFDALPFRPTHAQARVIEEIVQDVMRGYPMNRLLQGDVGSGKTIVAAALLVLAAQNGFQGALMAPTELLAAQHAQSLAPVFSRLGISYVLLTGSMTAAQKRTAASAVAEGSARIVIGTHALIQQSISFDRLAAVVLDEQHRFGVSQRAALSQKGISPHVLAMSATPIPRTLALILYGELDISVLDELPPGRQTVKTYAVGEDMRTRITAFIDKQVRAGGQVYVVCPAIMQGEMPIKSAEAHAETLRAALPHRRIGLLHGKMKSTEKDAVMSSFVAGDVEILVATTVIEVGVDVPNATLMVVEDADRFGLSQLHQLRGRVGRGKKQSYCVLFGADKGAAARERLHVLCRTADGFEISQADLALRGPGDFFGLRQSGLPTLHTAHLTSELTLMQSAADEAAALLRDDPTLARYPDLRARLTRMFSGSDQAPLSFS